MFWFGLDTFVSLSAITYSCVHNTWGVFKKSERSLKSSSPLDFTIKVHKSKRKLRKKKSYFLLIRAAAIEYLFIYIFYWKFLQLIRCSHKTYFCLVKEQFWADDVNTCHTKGSLWEIPSFEVSISKKHDWRQRNFLKYLLFHPYLLFYRKGKKSDIWLYIHSGCYDPKHTSSSYWF